jgi:hypothetical protein
MVYLANNDIYGGHDVIGQCALDMMKYRDQMKHDEWYELEVPPNELMQASRMSNSTAGQVHLIIKWIFCRQKYLEAGLKKLD